MRTKIFSLPIDVPKPRRESKLHDEQHKGQKVYTSLGHRCGVIPYSSVWWWIASGADDEQYRGRTASRGVFLGWCAWRGMAPSLLALGEISLLYGSGYLYFIEALVLLPNIERDGSQQRPF